MITGASGCTAIYSYWYSPFLDQKTLESEIGSLRDGLKPKVSQLHKMEGWLHTVVVLIIGTKFTSSVQIP